jgi:hypothetical protein
MSKKANNPMKASPMFVFGHDENGKPRGARFAETLDSTATACFDIGLKVVASIPSEMTELVNKLPLGRVYSSGKAFVPNIRKDLYDKIIVGLAKAAEDGNDPVLQLNREPDAQAQPASCVSPITSGLPRSWETIGVGHMVLVHEGPADGWWEAVVEVRDGEMLTMRYRDYPKQPTFSRHINTVALVNPGPA